MIVGGGGVWTCFDRFHPPPPYTKIVFTPPPATWPSRLRIRAADRSFLILPHRLHLGSPCLLRPLLLFEVGDGSRAVKGGFICFLYCNVFPAKQFVFLICVLANKYQSVLSILFDFEVSVSLCTNTQYIIKYLDNILTTTAPFKSSIFKATRLSPLPPFWHPWVPFVTKNMDFSLQGTYLMNHLFPRKFEKVAYFSDKRQHAFAHLFVLLRCSQ